MAQGKKIPLRRCIGCGEMKEKRALVRICLAQDGQILPDPSGRMNGRGAYICRNADCLRKAERSHALERSFRRRMSESALAAVRRELEHECGEEDPVSAEPGPESREG